MQIFLSTARGTVALDVHPCDSVGRTRLRAAAKERNRQRLGQKRTAATLELMSARWEWGGRPLLDDCTLQECGISDAATIHIMGRLRGGGRKKRKDDGQEGGSKPTISDTDFEDPPPLPTEDPPDDESEAPPAGPPPNYSSSGVGFNPPPPSYPRAPLASPHMQYGAPQWVGGPGYGYEPGYADGFHPPGYNPAGGPPHGGYGGHDGYAPHPFPHEPYWENGSKGGKGRPYDGGYGPEGYQYAPGDRGPEFWSAKGGKGEGKGKGKGKGKGDMGMDYGHSKGGPPPGPRPDGGNGGPWQWQGGWHDHRYGGGQEPGPPPGHQPHDHQPPPPADWPPPDKAYPHHAQSPRGAPPPQPVASPRAPQPKQPAPPAESRPLSEADPVPVPVPAARRKAKGLRVGKSALKPGVPSLQLLPNEAPSSTNGAAASPQQDKGGWTTVVATPSPPKEAPNGADADAKVPSKSQDKVEAAPSAGGVGDSEQQSIAGASAGEAETFENSHAVKQKRSRWGDPDTAEEPTSTRQDEQPSAVAGAPTEHVTRVPEAAPAAPSRGAVPVGPVFVFSGEGDLSMEELRARLPQYHVYVPTPEEKDQQAQKIKDMDDRILERLARLGGVRDGKGGIVMPENFFGGADEGESDEDSD